MELIARWLESIDRARAPRLAPILAALPGRPVYPGPHRDRALASVEWSLREGSGARLAFSIDPEHVEPGAIHRALAALASVPERLGDAIADLHGSHFQIGVADDLAKLYLYARGAPEGALDLLLRSVDVDPRFAERAVGARAPAFVALDLHGPGADAKLYFEEPDAAAAAAVLRRAGRDRLASIAVGLPSALGTPPAPFVVSLRGAASARDATLHVKIDRAAPRLRELAGERLADRATELFRTAVGLGLELAPTYASWLDDGRGEPRRTLYYRLDRRTPLAR